MANLIQYEYEGNLISFEIDEEIMINATEMAKPFGKKVNNFLRMKQTQDYIEEFTNYLIEKSETLISVSLDIQNIKNKILRIVKGNFADKKKQGTWMHQELALKFAAWLSPKFEVWVFQQIKTLLKTGSVSLQNTQSNDIADLKEYFKQELAKNNTELKDYLDKKLLKQSKEVDKKLLKQSKEIDEKLEQKKKAILTSMYMRFEDKFDLEIKKLDYKIENYVLPYLEELREEQMAESRKLFISVWEFLKGVKEKFRKDTIAQTQKLVKLEEKLLQAVQARDFSQKVMLEAVEILITTYQEVYKPSEVYYVYLFRSPSSGFYKIGISKRPYERPKDFQLWEELEIIHKIKMGAKRKAELVESLLKLIFKDQNVYGEWFDFGDIDLAVILKL